jgi:hypothetical protein
MKETRINPSIKWKDYIGVLSIDDLQFDVSYSLAVYKEPTNTSNAIITTVGHCLDVVKAQYNNVYPSNVYRLPDNERELVTVLMMALNCEGLGFVTIRPYCAY